MLDLTEISYPYSSLGPWLKHVPPHKTEITFKFKQGINETHKFFFFSIIKEFYYAINVIINGTMKAKAQVERKST